MTINKYITTRIRNSEFLRNTFQLVLGTGIAQLITILVSPVITRLYSPDDFGSFSFFVAVVGGFVLIATLRYELAIVYTHEEKDAVNVFVISSAITIAVSLFLLIAVTLLWFLYPPYRTIEPFLQKAFFILPVMVLFLGAANILQNWLVRQKRFRTISISKVINSFTNNGLVLVFGLAGTGVWGLLTGNFIALVLFVSYLILRVFIIDRSRRAFYDPSSIKPLARRYKDLPTSNTLQAIIELLQSNGIIYLCRIFFTSSTVGLYSLSVRVLQAPLWLVGSSISQVYMKEAAETVNNKGNLRASLMKTIKFSGMLSLPIMVVLILAGPWLFSFVWGKSWYEAGVYARILAPWMFFDFIRYCIGQTPLLIGKTTAMLRLSVIGSIILVISFTAGKYLLTDVRPVLMLVSFCMSLYAAGVVLWIIKIASDHKFNVEKAA